jgi:hypothetical protein
MAAGALRWRERGEAAIDCIDIGLLRIEVAAAPLEQFRVTLVLRICDGHRELAIAPRSSDILGRAAPGASTRCG